MRKSKFSERQVVAILKEGEAGMPVAEVCRETRHQRADVLRLEEQVRRPSDADVPVLTVEQLHWLLEGIDIGVVQRHPRRMYAHVG